MRETLVSCRAALVISLMVVMQGPARVIGAGVAVRPHVVEVKVAMFLPNHKIGTA